MAKERNRANETRSDAARAGETLDPRRVSRAEELFAGVGLNGPMSTRAIELTLSKEFEISQRQARRYLTKARANFKTLSQSCDPDALIEQTDAMLLDAFEVAKAKRDPHGMVAAAQRRAELRGVFKREVQIDAKVSGLADLLNMATEHDRSHASTKQGGSR